MKSGLEQEHELRRRRREVNLRMEAYEIASKPVIKLMTDLRLIGLKPSMTVHKDGSVECADQWEPWAKELYDKGEKLLKEIAEMYLKHDSQA